MAVKSNTGRYAIWLLAAVGIHAMLLFGPWGILRQDATYSVSPEEGIEVSIVESSPEPAQAAPAPAQAPTPEVAVVEPAPEPPPVPTPPPDPLREPKPDPVPDLDPPKPPDKPEKPDKLADPGKPKPKPKPRAERPPKPARAAEAPHSHPAAPAPVTQGSAGASASQGAGTSGGSANSKPGYLSNPHPPYPSESKLNHEQGIVMLSVSIDERGEVVGVSVSQSSGFPRLDSAAREGVRGWRFRPARVAGFPVGSHLAVPIRFRLTD